MIHDYTDPSDLPSEKYADYQVVVVHATPRVDTLVELRDRVMIWLRRGYEPVGGIATLSSQDAATGQTYGSLAQVVVLRSVK